MLLMKKQESGKKSRDRNIERERELNATDETQLRKCLPYFRTKQQLWALHSVIENKTSFIKFELAQMKSKSNLIQFTSN